MEKKFVEKIAWPKHPIENYMEVEGNDWGYLIFFDDKTYEFINERPSNEEILERWGYIFKQNRNLLSDVKS